MKLLIVGGVAGGASAAARARRLSETAEIVLFERGPDVSFANCGLPYYLGGKIAERQKLLIVTPQRMRERFRLDVRTRSSVERIDRQAKRVLVKELDTGRQYEESYDKLLLSPGAAPILPQLPGVRPTQQDWSDHLTTIFPEVRLKKFLEMRGADTGPWRTLCALPALWVGVLYHQASLDGAWELVKDWSAEDRQKLREAVPREALQAKVKGRLVQDVAKDMLALSRTGLGERRIVGCKGKTETRFLDDLDDIAASGRTRAEDLLQLYDTSWNHDVRRVFRDFAY